MTAGLGSDHSDIGETAPAWGPGWGPLRRPHRRSVPKPRCAGKWEGGDGVVLPPSGAGPASLHLWSRDPPCAAAADGDVGEAEGEEGDACGGSDGPPEEEGRGGGVAVGADAEEQHHLGASGGGEGMNQ